MSELIKHSIYLILVGRVRVEGLLGVTLDDKEIFLVRIDQTVQKDGKSGKAKPPKKKHGKPARKKRKECSKSDTEEYDEKSFDGWTNARLVRDCSEMTMGENVAYYDQDYIKQECLDESYEDGSELCSKDVGVDVLGLNWQPSVADKLHTAMVS